MYRASADSIGICLLCRFMLWHTGMIISTKVYISAQYTYCEYLSQNTSAIITVTADRYGRGRGGNYYVLKSAVKNEMPPRENCTRKLVHLQPTTPLIESPIPRRNRMAFCVLSSHSIAIENRMHCSTAPKIYIYITIGSGPASVMRFSKD